MEQAREEYWAALTRGDRFAAMRAVRRLREAGLGPLELVQDLVVPAQERIGALWESGAWDEEQEHAATAVNEGLVHWLCSFAEAPDADGPLVVVACLLGERHALPALVVAEALNAHGVQVNYLGGDPDPDELLEQVLALKPRAVVLSGSLTSSLAGQRELLGSLGAIGVPVVVGGSAFGGQVRRALAVGATAHADDVDRLVEVIHALPARLPARAVEAPTPAEAEADWLLSHRSALVEQVTERLAARHPGTDAAAWRGRLGSHLAHVVGCLASAMVTADETIVVEAGEWLERVLAARGAPADVVPAVWALLAEALRGQPLARLHLAGAAPVAPAPVDAVAPEPAARADARLDTPA